MSQVEPRYISTVIWIVFFKELHVVLYVVQWTSILELHLMV